MTQDELQAIIARFPGGIAQGDIRQHIDLHETTISKQVRKLEQYNLIRYELVGKAKVWYPT